MQKRTYNLPDSTEEEVKELARLAEESDTQIIREALALYIKVSEFVHEDGTIRVLTPNKEQVILKARLLETIGIKRRNRVVQK